MSKHEIIDGQLARAQRTVARTYARVFEETDFIAEAGSVEMCLATVEGDWSWASVRLGEAIKAKVDETKRAKTMPGSKTAKMLDQLGDEVLEVVQETLQKEIQEFFKVMESSLREIA